MRKLALAILIGCTASAFASTYDFNKAYDDVNKSMLKKDFGTVEKLLKSMSTLDFKYVPRTGPTMTLAQTVAQMKQQMGGMDKIARFTSKITKNTITANKAVITIVSGFTGMIKDAQGKTHTVTSDGVATDTWIKDGGIWKIKEMKIGTEKVTMDGKPFNPTAG